MHKHTFWQKNHLRAKLNFVCFNGVTSHHFIYFLYKTKAIGKKNLVYLLQYFSFEVPLNV